jgi:hypothetical protein
LRGACSTESELVAGSEPRSAVISNEMCVGRRGTDEQVLAAIRVQQFYILTHPQWNSFLEHRVDNILEGKNRAACPCPASSHCSARLAAAGVHST